MGTCSPSCLAIEPSRKFSTLPYKVFSSFATSFFKSSKVYKILVVVIFSLLSLLFRNTLDKFHETLRARIQSGFAPSATAKLLLVYTTSTVIQTQSAYIAVCRATTQYALSVALYRTVNIYTSIFLFNQHLHQCTFSISFCFLILLTSLFLLLFRFLLLRFRLYNFIIYTSLIDF
jgi:hypothetical protein